MTIIKLLNKIKNDNIVLPGIQRDFVWSKDKITKLLDSIMRGYPIGITLLWETYNDIQYRLFEDSYVEDNLFSYRENKRNKKIQLVLDGQQRLQSLYLSLYGKYNEENLYFDILSGRDTDDLAEEKYIFEFSTTKSISEKNNQNMITDSKKETKDHESLSYYRKVSDLFSMSAYQKKDFTRDFSKKFSLSQEDEVRIELNLARLDEAMTKDESILKETVIDEDLLPDSPYRKTEADVLEIFVRVNREGTPLSRSDLIFSMLKLNWKESAESLPIFLRTVNEGNSFNLDTDFVIRSLFAVSNLGTRFDIDILRKKSNVAKLRNNFVECCDAIRATVDFVKRECRCESSRLIGGLNTLVPFVYYLFYTNKHQIRNDQLAKVKKGVYLFSLSKPFSRWGDSRLQKFIKTELKPLLDDGDERFPLGKVAEWVDYWEKCETISDYMQRNIPLTLHLIQGLSGAKIQYKRNLPEIDHIFPRSELRRKNMDKTRINHYANFWILAKELNQNKSKRHPADYFKDVGNSVLNNALLEREYFDYRRYNNFLKRRSELMQVKFEKIIGMTDDDLRDFLYE